MRKKIVVVFAAVVTISSLLISRTGLNRLEGKEKPGDSCRVEKVNDGDTITVTIGRSLEKIRLIGIDAPEMGQEPWGRMAREHLKALINSSSQNVTLEYDVVKRDKYGRKTEKGDRLLLSYCRLLHWSPSSPNPRYILGIAHFFFSKKVACPLFSSSQQKMKNAPRLLPVGLIFLLNIFLVVQFILFFYGLSSAAAPIHYLTQLDTSSHRDDPHLIAPQ